MWFRALSARRLPSSCLLWKWTLFTSPRSEVTTSGVSGRRCDVCKLRLAHQGPYVIAHRLVLGRPEVCQLHDVKRQMCAEMRAPIVDERRQQPPVLNRLLGMIGIGFALIPDHALDLKGDQRRDLAVEKRGGRVRIVQVSDVFFARASTAGLKSGIVASAGPLTHACPTVPAQVESMRPMGIFSSRWRSRPK